MRHDAEFQPLALARNFHDRIGDAPVLDRQRDPDNAFHHRHFGLAGADSHIESRVDGLYFAMASLDDERSRGVVGNLEKRLATAQQQPAFVRSIADIDKAAGCQRDDGTILQTHDPALSNAGAVSARLPGAVRRSSLPMSITLPPQTCARCLLTRNMPGLPRWMGAARSRRSVRSRQSAMSW